MFNIYQCPKAWLFSRRCSSVGKTLGSRQLLYRAPCKKKI